MVELDSPVPTKPSDDWGSDKIMQDPGAEWLSYAAPKFLTQLSELINVYYFLGFPGGAVVQNPVASAGDIRGGGLIPG